MLAFLLVFTISNTGLPLVLHYCTMGNKVKFDQCGMCRTHSSRSMKHGSSSSVNTAFSSKCCSTPISVDPIKEKYISVKSDHEVSIDQIIALTAVEAIGVSELNLEKVSFLSDSPPGENSYPLYLSNSVLRI
ncbi:MAG: hypothetical protein ACM3Q2_02190 [Syntrophothermus sp.]